MASSWVQVAGQLNSQTHIFRTGQFNSKLYGGTIPDGRLFEYDESGGQWVQVAPQLSSQSTIASLAEYNSELYAGTGNSGLLFKWNGTNAWTQVAPQLGGQSLTRIINFDGKIYATTGNTCRLYEWNGTNAWVQVAPQGFSEFQAYYPLEFNSELYAGTNDSGYLLKWNGTNAWVLMASQLNSQTSIFNLVEYDSTIYGGTFDGGRLFEWNGTNAWTQVAPQLNSENYIYDISVFNNKIYGGTRPNGNLFEWNGTNAWVQTAGILNSQTRIYALEYFENRIYGGTYPNGALFVLDDAPIVSTDDVNTITGTSAIAEGTVVDEGASTVTERGFCYNTTGNPTISDTKATVSGTTGAYSDTITSLSLNTTYYLKAFATNSDGTGYGVEISFTTALSTTYTAKLEVLEFDTTDTMEAGTTTTTVNATGHGLVVGDFIVNTTRRGIEAERGSRVVLTVPDSDSFTVTAITGQVSTDSFRRYNFTDRTSLVVPKSIRCDLGTQGVSNISFDIITDENYIPQCGQYIRFGITTDSTYKRYFYGIIQDTSRRLMAENTSEVIMTITATSLNTIPNRRTIEVAYDADTDFGDIVQDMIDLYLVGDGISAGTINTGASLDEDWYSDIISISDVLDRCAKESGFQWFIDENGALQFYQDPSSITTNSIVIDEDALGTFGDVRNIRITENIDQYLNKYFIVGGYDERMNPILLGSEDFTESTAMQDVTAGTGVYGEVLRDNGIIGSAYITAEAGTTTTNITYTAHGQVVGDVIWNITQNIYRTVATVVDADNFTVTAITGQTTGDIIVFFDKANDIFDNIFKSQGRLPLRVTFNSNTLSFNAGEKIRIKLPSLGITDEYFLIEKVTLFDRVGVNATTTQGFSMNVSCIIRDTSNFSTQKLKNYTDFWGDF